DSPRPRRLLRLSRERQSRGRTAEQRYELATPHVPLRLIVRTPPYLLDVSRDMCIAEKWAARLPVRVKLCATGADLRAALAMPDRQRRAVMMSAGRERPAAAGPFAQRPAPDRIAEAWPSQRGWYLSPDLRWQIAWPLPSDFRQSPLPAAASATAHS